MGTDQSECTLTIRGPARLHWCECLRSRKESSVAGTLTAERGEAAWRLRWWVGTMGGEPERLAGERPDESISGCSPAWPRGVSTG